MVESKEMLFLMCLDYNSRIQLNMGCSQSNDASDPLQKSQSSPRKPLPPGNNQHHSPSDFLFTMVGNTATHGLVLGFTPSAFIPVASRIAIPRYCHALLQTSSIGYITGGIEDLESNVSSKATIDAQILQGTISRRFLKVNMQKLCQDPQNSFEVLPDMINARYAHSAIILDQTLFVIGGRQYGTDENGLLSACEAFDFGSKKWKAIPSMQFPRAAATVVIYGEHIYVLGGYSGNNNRTKAIESYSPGDSNWRRLPFSLHEGLEGALAVKKPNTENCLLLFGGKTNFGKSNRVAEINFDKSTAAGYSPSVQLRSFHKGILYDGQVMLVGGGCERIESYSIVQQRSTISSEPSYLQYCTMKQLNSFAQFQQQISMKFVKKNDGLPLFENRVCMFGHAFEPFTKVINTDNLVVISDGQSLMHSFYQFTTVVKVNKEHCFVLGGINPDLSEVTNQAYSFNLLDNQIKPLEPMITPRYAFSAAVLGSHLYAMGGRRLGDDQVAILNQCQRFSFETYKWEPIAAMKNKRQSATAIAYGELIIVIGGYKGSGAKSNQVEMYIPSENRWVELDSKFELSVQSMTPIMYANYIYLFGGCGDADIQKVFKLNIEIDQGLRYEKSVKLQLQPVGHLSNPGTNLKVFVDKNGMAFVFGNIPHGIDVYDLRKQKVAQVQQMPVFEKLQDPLFHSYTLIF